SFIVQPPRGLPFGLGLGALVGLALDPDGRGGGLRAEFGLLFLRRFQVLGALAPDAISVSLGGLLNISCSAFTPPVLNVETRASCVSFADLLAVGPVVNARISDPHPHLEHAAALDDDATLRVLPSAHGLAVLHMAHETAALVVILRHHVR